MSFAQVASAPGAATLPAARPANTLGAIRPSLGTSIAPNGLGNITTCIAAGAPGAAASFPVDQTDVTAAATAQFGTSAGSGGCITAAPPPGPGAITGAEYSNGADSLSVTEGGGSGLSPLIAVPPPTSAAPSCNSSVTAETSSMSTPFDSPGAPDTAMPPSC